MICLFPETFLQHKVLGGNFQKGEASGHQNISSSQTSHTAPHVSFPVSHPHLPVLWLSTPIIQGSDPAAQAKGWEQAEAWNKPSARPNRSSRKSNSSKAHVASIKGG